MEEEYLLRKQDKIFLFSIEDNTLLKNISNHSVYVRYDNDITWKPTELHVTIERMRVYWNTLVENGYTREYESTV